MKCLCQKKTYIKVKNETIVSTCPSFFFFTVPLVVLPRLPDGPDALDDLLVALEHGLHLHQLRSVHAGETVCLKKEMGDVNF